MGKIWFKGPDAAGTCCGCEGKAGPCTSCCPTLDTVFNTVEGVSGIPEKCVAKTNFYATSPSISKIGNGLRATISDDTFAALPRDFLFKLNVRKGEKIKFIATSKPGPISTFDRGFSNNLENSNAGIMIERGKADTGFETDITNLSETVFYNWRRKLTRISCSETFVLNQIATNTDENGNPRFFPLIPPAPSENYYQFFNYSLADRYERIIKEINNGGLHCYAHGSCFRNYPLLPDSWWATVAPFSTAEREIIVAYQCPSEPNNLYTAPKESVEALNPRTIQFEQELIFQNFHKETYPENSKTPTITDVPATCLLFSISSCDLYLLDGNNNEIDISTRFSKLYPDVSLP